MTRKLLREIVHLRGQLVAIIMVIGCGIGTYVMSRSMHTSLTLTQHTYYENGRYADVFASLQRAPLSVIDQLGAINGVAVAEGRTVSSVQVDVPGLPEPASATLVSVSSRRSATLNDIHLVSGASVPVRPTK
jgi:putative ABC transport system permease protein